MECLGLSLCHGAFFLSSSRYQPLSFLGTSPWSQGINPYLPELYLKVAVCLDTVSAEDGYPVSAKIWYLVYVRLHTGTRNARQFPPMPLKSGC